jgi:hypothetical protein
VIILTIAGDIIAILILILALIIIAVVMLMVLTLMFARILAVPVNTTLIMVPVYWIVQQLPEMLLILQNL